MIPLKRFYMIRHGQTEANAGEIMAGSLDSPLTALGRDQARVARDIMAELPEKPAFIVHSHLSRARDTAAIINEKLGLPMQEDPDIAEIHVGDLEGRPWSECWHVFDGWQDTPNGETAQQFFERVRRGKTTALSDPRGLPLIVSHGGVFRAFWKLYGHDLPPVVRNCHLHEFYPHPVDSVFPWKTTAFDYDRAVIRTDVRYHKSPDDIAE